MKKIILDTNAYSGFMSGDQAVFDCIVESETVFISTERTENIQRYTEFHARLRNVDVVLRALRHFGVL